MDACQNREIGDQPPQHVDALPPARAALAEAIAAVIRAQHDLEVAEKPVERLARARAAVTLGEAAALRAEIPRLRAAHESELDVWLDAGGSGERPELPAELKPIELALGKIAAAAREAEARFPTINADHVTAAERARNSVVERDRALWPASVEAADRTLRDLGQAILGVQSAEGQLFGLVSALREAAARAGDDGHGALAAAAKIEEQIIAARRHGAPRIDPTRGRSLIERLKLDPLAEL